MPYPLWPLYLFAALVALYKAWPWISALTPGAGAFLGALTGLLAILAGALYNAHLNWKRDVRIRNQNARGLALALYGELAAALVTCNAFIGQASAALAKSYDSNWLDEEILGANFGPRVSTKVYEASVDNLGLLGESLVGNANPQEQLVVEIIITFDMLLDYARIGDKKQTITRRDLLAARGELATNLRDDFVIALKETMAILQAYIAGGHPAAVKVAHVIMPERKNRQDRLGKELGIVPTTGPAPASNPSGGTESG